jgi:hypothetical protein
MPSDVRELKAQSTLIRDRVRQHKSSSPASIIQAIGQLKKGAEVIMLSAELMRDQITGLERANEAASKRRQHQSGGSIKAEAASKRRQHQSGGSIKAEAVSKRRQRKKSAYSSVES